MDVPEGFALRPTTAADVPALTRLLHAAYADLAAAGLNFTGATQSDEVTAARTLGGGASWVVVDAAGALAGTVTCSSPPSGGLRALTAAARAPGRVWLNQLAVRPDLRGRGLASVLWGALRSWAVDRGAGSVGLDTAVPARGLRRMYARWGFAEGDVVQWPGKAYRSVVMVRDLP
ncbi:GNAT family N-acetyltransferase [Cellulomonas sp. HD19AZ1]|uniref:GNAT family N-acetyltransferase n=1 Tax=Cellulomonas sp. HD19AZ1 TaxID=2559593 RepID=UPI00142FF1CF|nr:GNAT family N-acetyltransferase [Cellulomonas sp. HD19AZ1]